MNIGTEICSPKLPMFIALLAVVGSAFAADSDVARQLKSRTAEFNKEIIRVSGSVYTAVGYGVSPVSMIAGSQGLVIIDTEIDVASSKEIRAEAERIVRIAGGIDTLARLIESAMEEHDFQWAAELCDYVLALEPINKAVLLSKADALTALADDTLTATARNHYLSSTIELRKVAEGY